MNRLPPLNSLRAFEASAKHLSFKKAAIELSVTPAAISQQVKLLEETLEVQVFNRLTRALSLTSAGSAIYPAIKEGFDRFADIHKILHEECNTLRLTVSPLFGANWLIPRLEQFRALAPEIEVRIDVTDRLVDFEQDNIDIGLRYGTGNYENLATECLFFEHVIAVCSPKLITEKHPLDHPADLIYYPLLHSSNRNRLCIGWQMWLTSLGVTDIDLSHKVDYNTDMMILQAALEGQGIGLVDCELAKNEIENGRLVRLFPDILATQTERCFFVVHSKTRGDQHKIKTFKKWILESYKLELSSSE